MPGCFGKIDAHTQALSFELIEFYAPETEIWNIARARILPVKAMFAQSVKKLDMYLLTDINFQISNQFNTNS